MFIKNNSKVSGGNQQTSKALKKSGRTFIYETKEKALELHPGASIEEKRGCFIVSY